MPAIKSIIVKNMRKITLIMAAVILFLSTIIQIFIMRQTSRQNALQIFSQVEQILDENSTELERIRKEYETMCLNDARTAAYILEYNPQARNDVDELKKIAANVEVDEIHIFDTNGVIVAGTHPEYFGLTFDSGEQMNYFKPLLTDKSLELVQDVMPNTAVGKLFQYSALWSEDQTFIVQVGMDPSNVVRATEKNELSYIFSLLRTGVGYSLYAVNPDTHTIAGSTVISNLGKNITDIGFQTEHLESNHAFYTKTDQGISYCLSRRIGDNYIIWATPVSGFCSSVFNNNLLLLASLLLISVILVYAVTNTMNRAVIDQIKSQKEALEKQHEQLEIAAARAQAANNAKSEFLFNMSHDIRTPMNAILGFTNLALESSDPKAQREYLQNIDISSKQLLDLINSILELSRIENHKVLIEEELIEVSETYRRLCTIFDSDLKKKHLTYSISQDIEHPYLYMDTTHYSQIFLNIVSNAIKYTPDGGCISVSFKELPADEADACLIETVVEDNGIGMSQEFLSQAYESFSRERTSTVSGIQGTGLGLAIVKRLVDLMKGTIDIESRQGKGTKVTIRLPHRLGEAFDAAEAEETDTLDYTIFEGKRILLAEDIDINALIAKKLLCDKGCIVERAKDGIECIDMLSKAGAGYYDLILMDIQMPNMDGYKTAVSIRAFTDSQKASIPILAMTANAFKEDRDKAIAAGMDGHIAKPLDAANMFKMIAAVLP